MIALAGRALLQIVVARVDRQEKVAQLHVVEEGIWVQTVELRNQSNEVVLKDRRRWTWPATSPPSMHRVSTLFQRSSCRDEGKILNEFNGSVLPKDDRNPAPSGYHFHLTNLPYYRVPHIVRENI